MKQEDTGKSLASRLKHQFMYGLIFIGGRTLAYLFLYGIVFCYTCSSRVFNRSRAYITRRFSPATKWQLFKHTYLLNLTFARTLVDRAALGILGRTEVQTTPEEQELLTKLVAQNKGILLLTAHVGCWQMAVNLMNGFLSTHVHVLYYRNPNDYDKTVSAHQHTKAPYSFINPAGLAGGMVEMMGALEKKEIVCAMADRVFGAEKNTVKVNFLGGRICVPYSFYRLAGATGAPVVFLFFPWQGKGIFSTWTCEPFYVPDEGANKANYIRFAQQFASALEEFCIKYPYQFFNYYNLWEID